MALSCIWYVSFRRPWEISALGCLASALREQGVLASIFTECGTEGLDGLDAQSWVSLNPFEKLFTLIGKSKLWHLWGDAPGWWDVVRARARTVHTKLTPEGTWRGHPSVMARALAQQGESVILPAFEVMVDWNDSSNFCGHVPVNDDGQLKLEEVNMSNAILAAYASLQGIPVVARRSAVLDEILGPSGYLLEDGSDAHVTGAARRYIQDNFNPSESAKKLASLYAQIMKIKGAK